MCRVEIMLRLCLTFRVFYPNYAYKRLALVYEIVHVNTNEFQIGLTFHIGEISYRLSCKHCLIFSTVLELMKQEAPKFLKIFCSLHSRKKACEE